MRKQLLAGTALVAADDAGRTGGAVAADKKMMKPSDQRRTAHPMSVIGGILNEDPQEDFLAVGVARLAKSTRRRSTPATDAEVHFNGQRHARQRHEDRDMRVELEGQNDGVQRFRH